MSEPDIPANIIIPCHCCGARAEMTCHICKAVHCNRCQSISLHQDTTYEPLGFCPECRGILIFGFSHIRADLPAPADWEKTGAAEETSVGGPDPMEIAYLEMAEALFLARRSVVPLKGTDWLETVMLDHARAVVDRRFPTDGMPRRIAMETWHSLPDAWGKINLFLRVGEAIRTGTARTTLQNLYRETLDGLETGYRILVLGHCIEIFSGTILRTCEDGWARAGDLLSRLVKAPKFKSDDEQVLREAITHMKSLILLYPLQSAFSAQRVSPLLMPKVIEGIRFETHLASTKLRKSGLQLPKLLGFLDETEKVILKWLSENQPHLQPGQMEMESYRLYIESGAHSFRANAEWSCSRPPRDIHQLELARSWAWVAVCTGYLSGHFSAPLDDIGNRWIAYLSELDRKLIYASRAERNIVKDQGMTLKSRPFLELAAFLKPHSPVNDTLWSATLTVHSTWEYLRHGYTSALRPMIRMNIDKLLDIERQFPWACSYAIHLTHLMDERSYAEHAAAAATSDGVPGQPDSGQLRVKVERAPAAGEVIGTDAWAMLRSIEGIKVFGDPKDSDAPIWVINGQDFDARPPVIEASCAIVSLGLAGNKMDDFGRQQGWSLLANLCRAIDKKPARTLNFLDVMDFGGAVPTIIAHLPDQSIECPSELVLLHDPDFLLAPDTISSIAQNWEKIRQKNSTAPSHINIYAGNRSLMSLDGLLK